MLQFLEERHPEILKLYLEKYHIDNWREYFKAILPVIHHGVFANKDGLGYLTTHESESREKSEMFLNALALTPNDIYEVKTDFIHARSSPLFKIDNSTFLVIDSVLVINKLYNSIFFEIFSIIKNNKISIKPYKDVFQFYTTEFIENYISYKLLDVTFSRKQIYKISGKEIKEKHKIDTEPDYYARNGNKVYLFEIKGSFITGSAKQSFSYSEIENELIQKYYKEDNGSKKAVLQLVERIEIIFSGRAVYDKGCKPNSSRVFPLLLTSEPALMCTGVNFILNAWFQEEIAKSEILSKSLYRIHPLIIMDIDSLSMYANQFQRMANCLSVCS